ncbi:MAG: RluA family pseudouridine synthase [Clostridia bacterium]|nr:RluA family pseudouridine synthase [Clostridia bacterium]
MPEIVYEDNHLLIISKPANMLTQSDNTGDESLHEWGKAYIKEKYQKPGEVYLGLVHRLDRPVGGLVAFARTSKSASRLSEQLRSHHMEREYLAVVTGSSLPDSATLHDWLEKNEDTGNVHVVQAKKAGAQEAKLAYRVLARDTQQDTALLHVRLQTGRKHQIRVQLANSGHPIVHDMRYGHGVRGENIALWGAVLRLDHPTQKVSLCFLSYPKASAFTAYAPQIRAFLDQQTITSHQ